MLTSCKCLLLLYFCTQRANMQRSYKLTNVIIMSRRTIEGKDSQHNTDNKNMKRINLNNASSTKGAEAEKLLLKKHWCSLASRLFSPTRPTSSRQRTCNDPYTKMGLVSRLEQGTSRSNNSSSNNHYVSQHGDGVEKYASLLNIGLQSTRWTYF